MRKTTKPSMTERQLADRFQTEESCKQFLAEQRWPDGKVHCPRCNLSIRVYALKTRPFHWVCKHCAKNGYRFSVLAGSVFENTNVPLRTWFKVIYRMTQAKKGVSALEVWRIIDPVRGSKGSYRTAWYMCHRIRAAMKNGTFRKLTGVVEIDETYVGGKESNRHVSKRRGRGSGYLDKVPVIGAIARKGNVVCQVIERAAEQTLGRFIQRTVSPKVELVATDEHQGYKHVIHEMPHETVTHSAGEYVRGVIHTQNLDSFWSLLKRGIMGNFHHVSKQYLPLYVNEFTFRHNNRRNPDIFRDVLRAC